LEITVSKVTINRKKRRKIIFLWPNEIGKRGGVKKKDVAL